MTLMHDKALIQTFAQDYRKRGYDVQTETLLDGEHPIDLLATKGDEARIVEVGATEQPMPAGRREAVLAWLAARPDRHLDLVISTGRGPTEVASRDEIAARLAESESLARAGAKDPALMLAWAVFEAAARRRIFERRGVVIPGADLLSSVAREGLIELETVDALRAVQRTRNAVVHGFFQPVGEAQVALLHDTARALLVVDEPEAPPTAIGQ